MRLVQQITIDEILDEFQFLEEWESQCDYLIDLGLELPKLSEEERTEDNRIHGCQSLVWLVIEEEQLGNDVILHIQADSDTIFVKGLVTVLVALYSGKTVREILAINEHEVFQKLGLDLHLLPTRKNGLFSMVQRVKERAEQVLQ